MIKNKNVCVSAICAVNIRIPYRGRESTGGLSCVKKPLHNQLDRLCLIPIDTHTIYNTCYNQQLHQQPLLPHQIALPSSLQITPIVMRHLHALSFNASEG